MAGHGSKGPEALELARRRRRLEDALEETRWGLEREFGWKLRSKGAAMILLAVAAGFVASRVFGRRQGS